MCVCVCVCARARAVGVRKKNDSDKATTTQEYIIIVQYMCVYRRSALSDWTAREWRIGGKKKIKREQ